MPLVCSQLLHLWLSRHFGRQMLQAKKCVCVDTNLIKIPGFSTRYPTTCGSRPRGRHLDYTLTLGDVGLSSVTCERCPQFGTYPHNNVSNTSTRQYHREFSLTRQVLIMHIPSYPTKDSFICKHKQSSPPFYQRAGMRAKASKVHRVHRSRLHLSATTKSSEPPLLHDFYG